MIPTLIIAIGATCLVVSVLAAADGEEGWPAWLLLTGLAIITAGTMLLPA